MRNYIVETQALAYNIDLLKERAGDAVIWGVVKGDGYGLGAAPLAKLLWAHGICHFAVTALSEARAIREAGLTDEPILMLSCLCDGEELQQLLALGVICTVGSAESARVLEEQAAACSRVAEAHIKIDTGMGRYGFLPADTQALAQVYRTAAHVTYTGIYTHFYDATVQTVTQNQFDAFQAVVGALRAAGIDPGMVHCCNSSAFWKFPHMHCDAVRLGSAILGRVAFSGQTGLIRVGRCEAQLEHVRTIPAGHTVGYGAGWKAKRETRIAVLSVGYSNGFGVERGFDLWRPRDCIRGMARYAKAMLKRRRLYVRVGDALCPVLGHVGMVNMVIDITGCACQEGDMAVVEINPLLVKGMNVVYTERMLP